MSNTDAFEELQNLFREQSTVTERIGEVQASLSDDRKKNSAFLAQRFIARSSEKIDFGEEHMREEQTYERLLQALRDLQAEIEERVRPVAEQVIHAEVERLRGLSEQRRSRLGQCLASIDESILGCRAQLMEYNESHADLTLLNEKLSKLGAEPASVPDCLPTASLADLIVSRIEDLRSQGKI